MARRSGADSEAHERAPQALLLDLVEWVAREPRTHADVMATWRTSCPRLPVWEDAVEQGYVARDGKPCPGQARRVVVTAQRVVNFSPRTGVFRQAERARRNRHWAVDKSARIKEGRRPKKDGAVQKAVRGSARTAGRNEPMAFPRASKALSRFTVLDLTRVRAGPTCVRQLADWGANVIKIEQPPEQDTGEPLGGPRDGPDFMNLHRNKRSITLDLKSKDGLAAFKRMVKKADVVVENFRPDVKKRLGIDYPVLKKINPQARLCLASPASARTVPMRPGPASTRSPRAWAD